MYYRLDKNGTLTHISVLLCDHHYKHFKYRTYYEKSDEDEERCCSILYDGTRCSQKPTMRLMDQKIIREANISEISEIKSVFKKHLKVFKYTPLQYENFNRFIYLMITTVVHEIFNNNHNVNSTIEQKLMVQYSYFIEKLFNNFEGFKKEDINISDNLNDILPKRIKHNALQSIPKKHYKVSDKFTDYEKKMYRNYVIFMNLLFAINDRSDRGEVYCRTFFKETLDEYVYVKLFYEIFKGLFNQTELIKETDFPKIHFLMEEKFQSDVLPATMLNILYHYDKGLLEDSFN